MSRMNRGMSVPGRYPATVLAGVGCSARVASSAMAPLSRPQLLEQARVGIHAEARALGHRDAAAVGIYRVIQRIVGEVTVEALDRRVAGHRRDAVDRREQARA